MCCDSCVMRCRFSFLFHASRGRSYTRKDPLFRWFRVCRWGWDDPFHRRKLRRARHGHRFQHFFQNGRHVLRRVILGDLNHHVGIFFQHVLGKVRRDVTFQTRCHHFPHVVVRNSPRRDGAQKARELAFQLENTRDRLDDFRWGRSRGRRGRQQIEHFVHHFVLVPQPVRVLHLRSKLFFRLVDHSFLAIQPPLFGLRFRSHFIFYSVNYGRIGRCLCLLFGALFKPLDYFPHFSIHFCFFFFFCRSFPFFYLKLFQIVRHL